MSVFRELPAIAKHVIIRILFINQPIARQLIDTWVKPEKADLLEDAVTARDRQRERISVPSCFYHEIFLYPTVKFV